MATTFNLRITMNDKCMYSAEDVADALHKVAYEVEQSGESNLIFDEEGLVVGTYGFNNIEED